MIEKSYDDTAIYLRCLIIPVLRNNSYDIIHCPSGILEVTYGGNELNLVATADFSELENIPTRSLREAAKAQSVVGPASGRQFKCMCKGACLDSRCSCRKAKQNCSEHCHRTSSNCQNSY